MFRAILFAFLTLPLTAHAAELQGPGASGGGKAVVCRNADGTIKSAELLDIYEGRILYQRRFPTPTVGFYEFFNQIDQKIQALHVPWVGISQGLTDMMEKKATFLAPGTRLAPTEDALEIIVPTGCALEQLAVYNLRLDRLFVDVEIWNSMDELNHAGLLLHEEIYQTLRYTADEADSFYTRQVVAYLLSDSPLEPLNKPMDGHAPKKVYDCAAIDRSGGRAGSPITNFALYQRDNGDMVVQRTNANRRMLFAETTSTIPLNYLFFGSSGKPVTLEELAGERVAPFPAREMGWLGHDMKNASGSLGWTETLTIHMVPVTKKTSRLQIEIGYYRTGMSSDGVVTYPVTCHLEK